MQKANKNLFALLLLLVLSLSLPSCMRSDLVETASDDKSTSEVFVSFKTPVMEKPQSATKASSEVSINDVNLFVFLFNEQSFKHVYLSKGNLSTTLTLPHRKYDVYAIANHGSDLGSALTQDQVKAIIASIPNEATLSDKGLPMACYKSIEVNNNNPLTLEVERRVAKVEVNISVASGYSEFTPDNITLCNNPTSVGYYKDNIATQVVDYAQRTHKSQQIFYVAENLQGVNNSIRDQKDKNKANAPKNATYLHIEGHTAEKLVSYNIYLGANNSYDFNVKGNNHYIVDLTISGENTVDTRVSVVSFDVAQQFGNRYEPTEIAKGSLVLTASNTPAQRDYTLQYKIVSGTGTVKINGNSVAAGVPFKFLSKGATSSTANVEYTQNSEGAVEIEFTVSDGVNTLTRTLSTSYENTQVFFTVTQPFEDRIEIEDINPTLRVAYGALRLSTPSNAERTFKMAYYYNSVGKNNPRLKVNGTTVYKGQEVTVLTPGQTSKDLSIEFQQNDESKVSITFVVKSYINGVEQSGSWTEKLTTKFILPKDNVLTVNFDLDKPFVVSPGYNTTEQWIDNNIGTWIDYQITAKYPVRSTIRVPMIANPVAFYVRTGSEAAGHI